MSAPYVITGKCSTFGGPRDSGVAPSEDLALYEHKDLAHAPPHLFLAAQPPRTSGTARDLDPSAYYCAMRWAYTDAMQRAIKPGLGVCLPVTTSHAWLLHNPVFVRNPNRPDLPAKQVYGVDWGPNSDTGRIIDLSPGLAHDLGVETDGIVEVTIPAAA